MKDGSRTSKQISDTTTKTYPLEIIEWQDIESDVDWDNASHIREWGREILLVSEVGFIVYEDDWNVVMCSQITSDGEFGNRTRIMKSVIKTRRKISG